LNHNIGQGNIHDLPLMLADTHRIADGKLVGKHDEQSADHIGNVIAEQERNGHSHDGDAGQELFGVDAESDHQSEYTEHDIEDGGNLVKPQDVVTTHTVIFLVPPPVNGNQDKPADGNQDASGEERIDAVG